MKAAIITIGDEILIGQVVDTNSTYIASRLNGIGVEVGEIISIRDDKDIIKEAVGEAFADYDITIITGGLGPTKDDITKAALAELFDSPLIKDEATEEHVRKLLESRGVPYNGLNATQSLVPDKFRVIKNNHGTAPAMWHEEGDKILISLPGVPFEMKELMKSAVIPSIVSKIGEADIYHKTMLTFGLAESVLAEKIAAWEAELPEGIKLAYLPSSNGVRLRLSSYGAQDGHREIDNRFSYLQKELGENFIGFEDKSLEEYVADRLRAAGRTVSVAESCTGGALSARFTSHPGASSVFMGGVTAYANEVKMNVLAVDGELLRHHGAVSQQVAEQMAENVRALTGSDYSIATTGIAGPDGGTEEKPVGTVWIAVSSATGTVSQKFVFGNIRSVNIERSISNGLYMLYRVMQNSI